MTTTFFAQPYDITAAGFYFETLEEYRLKANALRNDHGEVVEEFEIQFIDGEEIDCALSKAASLSQANLGDVLKAIDDWSEEDKLRFIVGVEYCSVSFDLSRDDPNELDVDIYHLASLRELAEQFVDDGICGDIPEAMRFYFDYDAFARDLGMDYFEVEIAGQRLVCRCA
ncbi:antirestriction protein ArdA [Aestuariibius sp. 2305UL40-4]|uniref:antirestriction protein ArdA n=1 Tax=Aestuariibius violaceus TaxID=3234132 RepID=UPI00345E50DF